MPISPRAIELIEDQANRWVVEHGYSDDGSIRVRVYSSPGNHIRVVVQQDDMEGTLRTLGEFTLAADGKPSQDALSKRIRARLPRVIGISSGRYSI